jgi:RepB DNA-primase from phage plasmid
MTDAHETKHVSAVEYIRTNFHPSDRVAVLVRSGTTGEVLQRIASADRIAGASFQEWLEHKNEKESCDIYIGMNTLKPEAHSRTKEDIHTIHHLYLDIDHDGPGALTKIQQSNLVPPPNYIVNTSPQKFQVVWRAEGILQEQAEALQRAMARKFGGDPAATDSTRVLRLPGFINRKYEAEFRVQAEKHTDRIHHLQDFRIRTEPIDTDLRAPLRPYTSSSSDSRPLSQSEYDWAYAKRALGRGDDPELVIRRIAEYRAGDKHDPQYYATHTVRKVQASLRSVPADRSENADTDRGTKQHRG